ncbi:MCE family protein [Streptomyces sp. NPDC051940]|uniref:MCE family protein n=1 Tax=Streptomyces sp. NPDC051940 TaxID=3155675 RepID=UPI00341F482A
MAVGTMPRRGLGARLRDAAGGFSGRRLVVPLIVLALLAAGGVYGARALTKEKGTRFTAYFDAAVGVHEGSDLRILGVAVGTVDSIDPQGTTVKVTGTLDHGIKVPADVQAVVVSPSVVSGRYIQLSPAYESGPTLGEGDEIPASRTATPVEIDQLYESITDLTDALGPNGANKDGALSRLVDSGAANLGGNGKAIGDSIKEFGAATQTLSGASPQLFSTIKNLQQFTTMLKDNDSAVRDAERQLSDVTTFLADDKELLSGALRELAGALGKVETFVKDNRAKLKGNVDKLAGITQALVRQRASLAEMLDVAPLAADNFLKTYNPDSRTIDGRGNLLELAPGRNVDPPAEDPGTAGLVKVPESRQESLPALPLPTVGDVYGTPQDEGDTR